MLVCFTEKGLLVVYDEKITGFIREQQLDDFE